MASGKHESDKQRFRLCVPPCPRFVTGGDTHTFCALFVWVRSTLGQLSRETVRIVFAFQCGHSIPGERSLRRALSPVVPTVRVPPLPRQSGTLNHGDHRWIWQKDCRRARPFLLLSLPDLVLTLWRRKPILKRFPPPRERARGSRYLPLRTRVARSSIETRLWICHHSLSCLRSYWRW